MTGREEPHAGDPQQAAGAPGGGHAQHLVRVVRARRHAAVNRLQIALGWLQLGRPERATAALAEWCRQLEWEGVVLRQWPVETAALYLTWRALCEEAGIEVAWRAPQVQGPRAVVPGAGPRRPAAQPAGQALTSPGRAAAAPGRVAAELEAARQAALAAPGRRIWLHWDGLEGRLRWGLEGGDAGAATAAGQEAAGGPGGLEDAGSTAG